MSESAGSEPQFEHMEPRSQAEVASACSACQRTIPDVYFEAGGKVFCSACKEAVLVCRSAGSGFGRLAKAGLFGTVAAAVSAVVWYGIVKLTGYELGIVAVVVGLVVGGAVRMGAEQRGGWGYQALAVLLTYLAIASSYVPLVVESFREESFREEAAAARETGASAAATESPSEAVEPRADETLIFVSAIVVSLALPVLQVTEGGIIGLLIVVFALYEAWKINKRQTLAFTGPFQLRRSAGASPG